MGASSIKRSVVKVTQPARTSIGNFNFKEDIGVRPRALIRPDTQFINLIGYTVTIISARKCKLKGDTKKRFLFASLSI